MQSVNIYAVTIKGDNSVLGLAWTEKQAKKLVKGVNNLLSPHTQIEDYELRELLLPPFRQWLDENMECMPEPHEAFHAWDNEDNPGMELLRIYVHSYTDPLAWAMEIVEEAKQEPVEWVTDNGKERVKAMIGD